jgi:hypothetical protein
MKFNRKLIKRSGLYGSITIPPAILNAWTAVEQVEMTFDGIRLVIIPVGVKYGGNSQHQY